MGMDQDARSGFNTAPAPHGPGFVWHDPSVKANVVSSGASIIMSMTISLLVHGCGIWTNLVCSNR